MAAVVGVLLQLAVGFFTVTAVGLVSLPLWAIVVLVAIWVAATATLALTVRRFPLVAVLVPVANGLVLWGAIAAGESWLGWTG